MGVVIAEADILPTLMSVITANMLEISALDSIPSDNPSHEKQDEIHQMRKQSIFLVKPIAIPNSG